MPTYSVPLDLVQTPPSVKAGLPVAVEYNNRLFGCELIVQAGVLLQLPQVVISTAQMIFHRFYYRVTMQQYPLLYVAMTCVFLATKVEESPRKPRDILNVFHRILLKRLGRLKPDVALTDESSS